ncbi:MAG TPA: alpha/beta fold hydrolase [Steroidobacteraceae bacterium]|jgi:pimeloyl-ACP methyl ester carboxylesterase
MPPASEQPSPDALHDDQIVPLLRSGAHAALLSAYFGDLEYRELAQLAKLAATRGNPQGALVYVLPGMMGTKLGTLNHKSPDLIWLHPTAIAEGALMRLALPGTVQVGSAGLMLPGYLKLKLALEVAGFRCVFHPFDWREDLQDLARNFIRKVEHSGADKVFVIGHSMGGLVARAALGYDKQRRIAKLVQLGAPNNGSFAPVQALRATYPTVRKLAALDTRHSAEELARKVFLTLPGLYQLLPGIADGYPTDFFDPAAWPDDVLAPDPRLLQRAREVRNELPVADERCFLICGSLQDTIVAATVRDSMFEYTIQCNGDGTVPLALAQWPGARTWYVDENHGALTKHNLAIAATVDLLDRGDTERLSDVRPAPREAGIRTVTDEQLRSQATQKIRWDSLSLDSRRRILDPVISPEFLVPI